MLAPVMQRACSDAEKRLHRQRHLVVVLHRAEVAGGGPTKRTFARHELAQIAALVASAIAEFSAIAMIAVALQPARGESTPECMVRNYVIRFSGLGNRAGNELTADRRG